MTEFEKLVLQKLDSMDKRFDAIEQRLDNHDKRFDAIEQRLDSHDKRFDAIDKKFESIDKNFKSIDTKFDSIDTKFDSIDTKFDSVDKKFEELYNIQTEILNRQDDMSKDITSIKLKIENEISPSIKMLSEMQLENSHRLVNLENDVQKINDNLAIDEVIRNIKMN